MAKTPAGSTSCSTGSGARPRRVAAKEAEALQAAIAADGKDFELEPWDWCYYAEKVRKARYDLDEEALRPYFALDNVRDGAF